LSTPTIFISYSHHDKDVVDDIEKNLVGYNLLIKRDIRDVGYQKKFSTFMLSVRESDFVLMVISDNFLKSEYCMLEVAEFTKDNNYDTRILPIVLDNAKIYDYEDSIEYIKFWKAKYASLKEKVQTLDIEETTTISKGALRFREFSLILGSFIEQLRDINHKSFKELKNDNYRDILKTLGVKIEEVKISLESNPQIEQALSKKELSNQYSHEGKITVIGDPGVGKTSIISRIISDEYLDISDSTLGISVQDWEFESSTNIKYRVNFWDFGGQEIIQSIHHLFFSTRSIYLLIVDARSESAIRRIEYWLSVIKIYSRESKTIVVYSKKDERILNIDEKLLLNKYSNITNFVEVSARTGEGIEKLKNILKVTITQTDYFNYLIPELWLNFRKELLLINKPIISYVEFITLAHKYGMNENNASIILAFFHDLGYVLFLEDNPILDDYIVIQPNWITGCIYKILNDSNINLQYGRFNYKQASKIWRNFNIGNDFHNYLLEVMRKFELCFPLPNSDSFIIPDRLNPQEPEYEFIPKTKLIYEFRYMYMPVAIMTRLIVRMHSFIYNNLVWKNGVLLSNGVSIAIIKMEPYGNTIRIVLVNDENSYFYHSIRRELSQLHSTIANLSFDEMIQCSCSSCRDSDTPQFYKYSTLIKYITRGLEVILCPDSVENVSIQSIIDPIKDIPKRNESELVQLIDHIKESKDNEKSIFEKLNKVILLQPNVFGMGINLNELVKSILRKKTE